MKIKLLTNRNGNLHGSSPNVNISHKQTPNILKQKKTKKSLINLWSNVLGLKSIRRWFAEPVLLNFLLP